MKFRFKAKNQEGILREGIIESPTRDRAVDMIQEKGLIPISVDQEERMAKIFQDLEKVWHGISMEEMVVFYRQLGTLIDAKITIVTALKTIEEQTENKYLGSVLLEMVDDIENGMALSESMSKHRDIFSTLAVSMIKAGEISGNLQRSIIFVAESTEKTYQLNSKIKSALMYPGFVLAAAVIIGFVVFSFVIPKLTKIFDDMEVEIPWYTKLIISVGHFMESYWWAVLVLIGMVALAIYYYANTESGKEDIDDMKLKVPIFNKMFRYLYITRFSENLSILLLAGIPIVKSLTIVSDVVNNRIYKRMIIRAAEEVKSGGTMSGVFAKYSELPPILSKMIKVGEETGKTSEVLKNISDFYNQEIDRMTKSMTALIEPIMIVFLGIGVAGLVFAILMPIYSITSQIK